MSYLRSLSMMSFKAPVETSNRFEPIAEAPTPSGSSVNIPIEQSRKPQNKKRRKTDARNTRCHVSADARKKMITKVKSKGGCKRSPGNASR